MILRASIRQPWTRRLVALTGIVAATTPAAESDFETAFRIAAHGTTHSLHWQTRPGFNYELQVSDDLAAWGPTGVIVAGDGNGAVHVPASAGTRRFYRLRETAATTGPDFLLRPIPGEEVDLVDGVCFAFDLAALPEPPAKIHVLMRPAGVGSQWSILGTLDDFDEAGGIRFVRGCAIWIPEHTGTFEVQAAAIGGDQSVLATAVRTVVIGENEAPLVTLTGGPPSPSPTAQAAIFSTTVSDPQDAILRVEFFNHGELIGVDRTPPYGDQLEALSGRRGPALLRGQHLITAQAYDVRGAVGVTPQALPIHITAGNARPVLALISPQDGLSIQRGQAVTLDFTLTDPDGEADLAGVEALHVSSLTGVTDTDLPFGSLTLDTSAWQPGTNRIRLTATDRDGAESHPREIVVYVRDDPDGPGFARQLVTAIADPLSAPSSNESFTGVEASSSPFAGGLAAGLRIDSGILLTSGLAQLWNRGDRYDGAGESLVPQFPNYREPGDELLERRIAGYRSFDAASLDFDVHPTHGQLEIEYQFGSEEYDEWVNSYNDGFLITIDGVVSSFLPDGSGLVGVTSVNQVTPANAHLFLDDDRDIFPSVAPENRAARVEYDGMIRRLRVFAFVSPERAHRVRFVIGDVNDDQLDSALMLGGIRSVPVFR